MRDRTTQLLLLVTAILAGLAWQRGGLSSIIAGLLEGARLLWSVLPLLVAAFVIAGLVQVLVTKEMVARWLGRVQGGEVSRWPVSAAPSCQVVLTFTTLLQPSSCSPAQASASLSLLSPLRICGR